MKNLSTGTGLSLLAGAILGSTIIMRYGPADQAAHAAPPIEALKAVAAASTAQVTPTIVWYGVATLGYNASGVAAQDWSVVARAWSDGRIEIRRIRHQFNACGTAPVCMEPWQVVSDANMGYNAAADINFDSKVDGDDLGQLLAAWGDAPRHDIPPSDCPLNLVNP
jgi:hypothetical protein